MHDLPTGPALLALGREVLLNELLPLLPPEARLDARLVASSMAIAEREAMVGKAPSEAILLELRRLYRENPSRRNGGGKVSSGDGSESQRELLKRFAQDIRVGAFEASEPMRRTAHDILWQLTIAKLRFANPRFLTANGFK